MPYVNETIYYKRRKLKHKLAYRIDALITRWEVKKNEYN
jgi:hypothetical protein